MICLALLVLLQAFLTPVPVNAATPETRPKSESALLADLEVVNGKAETVTYHGRRAVHLLPPADHENSQDSILALIRGSDLQDGTIEADVSGVPRVGTPSDSRGFIGISFHVQPHGLKFENLYLRPTNGRADDQLRRNHSVQYTSEPDYPWDRLRKESPGLYESYVDLQPDEWTHMRIVVSGTSAKLYVNGASEPCLIVNDLKLGKTGGQVALWAHWTTEAYFSNLKVVPDIN
jgi:hypothetical protein